jgi:hypothetical protein
MDMYIGTCSFQADLKTLDNNVEEFDANPYRICLQFTINSVNTPNRVLNRTGDQ